MIPTTKAHNDLSSSSYFTCRAHTKKGLFNPNNGNFELRNNLINKTEEKVDKNEEVLGYDFIGVEGDGGFHSFHCHNITELLIEKFSLKLNKYGLFDKPEKQKDIREFLNKKGAPVERTPWFIVKVKRYENFNS